VVTSGTAITKVLNQNPQQTTFPVIDAQSREYMGYLRRDDFNQYAKEVLTCGELLKKVDPEYFSKSINADPHESATEALKKLIHHSVDVMAVVDHDGRYTGVLDIKELAEQAIP